MSINTASANEGITPCPQCGNALAFTTDKNGDPAARCEFCNRWYTVTFSTGGIRVQSTAKYEDTTSKPRTILEINRAEWICYNWIEVTGYQDITRSFIKGRERSPDEAAQAARDWDIWVDAWRGLHVK